MQRIRGEDGAGGNLLQNMRIGVFADSDRGPTGDAGSRAGLVPARRGRAHLFAEALFGVGAPVFAVEPDEDRGVGDGEGGFEDQHAEAFAGLVDVGDDLIVGNEFDRVVFEQVVDLGAVLGDTGGVLFGDVGKLGVHGDDGADVDGGLDGVEDGADHVQLVGVGLDNLEAGRGLQGVGRVDDQDPVAMAEQGHGFLEAGLPVGSGLSRGREGWCENEESGEEETSSHRGLSGARAEAG